MYFNYYFSFLQAITTVLFLIISKEAVLMVEFTNFVKYFIDFEDLFLCYFAPIILILFYYDYY